MKSKLLQILLLMLPLLAHAQGRQIIFGKVYSGITGIKDVLVVNQNAQVETRTDSLGSFRIKAQVGDLLILSDYKIITRKIRYTPDLVQNGQVLLEVKAAATELDEVVINQTNVTSQSLGIPMGRKYTPAERRLRTASGLDPVLGVGMMPGVSVSFDALLNAINGRTKRLKKELEVERREMLMAQVRDLYTDEELIQKYHIPQEYVNGFVYYCVEDTAFAAAINSVNKPLADLSLTIISKEYLDIIKDAP